MVFWYSLAFSIIPTDVGVGNGNPLQHSCLENPMGRGAWWATVPGIAKSQIQLSDWTMDVGSLISAFSAFSKSSLHIWKILVHILPKPSLKVFEYYLTSMWNECNCVVVWTFFGIAFLWDWNENWPFPVATAEFSKFAGILSVALSQHHLLEFEIAQLQSYRFH